MCNICYESKQTITMACIRVLLMDLILVVLAQSKEATTDKYLYDTSSELMTDLLGDKYKKNVAPMQHPEHPIEVTFGMTLQTLEQLDEATGILSTQVWLNLVWNDNRLSWNESKYENVQSLRIPPSSMWIPDITPYNVARPQDYNKFISDVVVSSTGDMLFVPPMLLHTYCSLDFAYYPFDQQICKIKFGSWTYAGSTVDLMLNSDKVDTSSYLKNRQWKLLEASLVRNTVQYACCPETYIDITATLTLQRTPGILFHVYLGPAVCTVLMIPVVFLLPPESNHKISIGGSLLVSQVVILSMAPDSIPAAHDSPPMIILFYLASIVLLCLSLACSVLIVNMWNRAKRGGSGVPVVLNRIFLGIFGRLLCIGRDDFFDHPSTTSASTNTDDDADRSNLVKDNSRLVFAAQWRQLAMVFDRLLMILFFVACFILVIIMVAFRPTHN